MDITVTPTPLAGVLKITPQTFRDERGFFMESYHKAKWSQHGIECDFVQDNHSRSNRGVVRGLHFQGPKRPQTRVVRCTRGEVLDVVVDLRFGSETFGKAIAVPLSEANLVQLLIPPEFAHGFAVLSDVADVQYKVSNHHDPSAEMCLAWDDPDLMIPWPFAAPTLSVKDRTQGMSWKEYSANPCYRLGHSAR